MIKTLILAVAFVISPCFVHAKVFDLVCSSTDNVGSVEHLRIEDGLSEGGSRQQPTVWTGGNHKVQLKMFEATDSNITFHVIGYSGTWDEWFYINRVTGQMRVESSSKDSYRVAMYKCESAKPRF